MNTRKGIFKLKKFNVFLIMFLAFVIISGNFLPAVLAYENNDISIKRSEINSLSQTRKSIINSERSSLIQADKDFTYTPSKISEKKNSLNSIKKEKVNKKEYVEGEVLVKYKDSKVDLDTFSGQVVSKKVANDKSLEKKEDLRKSNVSVFKIKDNKTVEQKVIELENDPSVEYAQPNYLYYPSSIQTNDPKRS